MDTYYNIRTHFLFLLLLGIGYSGAKKYKVPENPNWFKLGANDIRKTLKSKDIVGQAKNVILFIGDGMGFESVASARIYAGQRMFDQSGEELSLSLEKLPFTGILKTYSLTDQVPESAATGTALLTGRKVNGETIGVTEKITHNECTSKEREELEAVPTLTEMAHKAGKSTGIVTTARITHATPAACYAHTASRYYETDSDKIYFKGFDSENFNCVDIGRQLVEDHPYIKVLLGGGRTFLLPNNESDHEYPADVGWREDGRNLIQEWINDKAQRGVSHRYVWNNTEFQNVDPDNTEYLLGLFEQSHMRYEDYRQAASHPDPTLTDMTKKAINMLKKDDNGYFLMVEGARIDHGHHANDPARALQETVEFDKAVAAALAMVNPEETLIIVTADHAHSLTSGGWPTRGNDILSTDDRGAVFSKDQQKMPRLTLAYHNGPGYGPFFSRRDHTGKDTTKPGYLHDSLYPALSSTHGLFDVPVYAQGPFAHLVKGVHEQNYIAHVIAYASCIGDDKFESYCADQERKRKKKERKNRKKNKN